MTRNQIEYFKLQESKRANQASENRAREELEHTKDIDARKLSETQRHNLASEEAALTDLGIKSRNVDVSAISAQANTTQAQAAMRNAQTNERNAEINARNATTNALNASANLSNAQANLQRNVLEQSKLEESVRHNLEAENIQAAQVALQGVKLDQGEKSLEFEKLRTQAETKLKSAQTKANESQADYYATKTKYAGQENARAWISVGSNAVDTIGSLAVDLLKRSKGAR